MIAGPQPMVNSAGRMSTETDNPPPPSPLDPAQSAQPGDGKARTESGGGPESALEEARAEVSRLKDQLLRTAADFDNFRKRTRRELEDAVRRGREELLRELLPVFDNLERAAAHA